MKSSVSWTVIATLEVICLRLFSFRSLWWQFLTKFVFFSFWNSFSFCSLRFEWEERHGLFTFSSGVLISWKKAEKGQKIDLGDLDVFFSAVFQKMLETKKGVLTDYFNSSLLSVMTPWNKIFSSSFDFVVAIIREIW